MRRVPRVAAALLAAALSFCRLAFADGAAHGDGYHWLYFGGGDLWHQGGFAHGGILWSPGGLAFEGFTLKVLLAGGTYYYNVAKTNIAGEQRLAAVMPGWRIKQDRLEITFTAGPEMQQHDLDDSLNRLRGTHFGVRFGSDLWLQPTSETMIAGGVSVTSIGWQYWARAQVGVRSFGLVWIGPEYHAIGDRSYVQNRWGMHITGLRTFGFEWSVGAGYLYDSALRNGPYGRVGLNVRR